MAPEQALNHKSADARSDIFSLGCTLFEALTGDVALPGENAMEKLFALATKSVRRLSTLRPEIPPALDEVANKMLQREPDDRFQSALEVVEALEPFCLGYLAEPKIQVGGGTEVSSSDEAMKEFLGQLSNEDKSTYDSHRQDATVELQEHDLEDGTGEFASEELSPQTLGQEQSVEYAEGVPVSVWPMRSLMIGAAALALVVVAMLLAIVAIRINTPHGTILVEVNQPDAEISVDGGWITLKSPSLREPIEIRATEGKHKLEVRKEGYKLFTDTFVIREGVTPKITVRLERKGAKVVAKGPNGTKKAAHQKEPYRQNKTEDQTYTHPGARWPFRSRHRSMDSRPRWSHSSVGRR